MQLPDLSQARHHRQAAAAQRGALGRRGRAAREGIRHLARLQLGGLAQPGRGAGARAAGAGHRRAATWSASSAATGRTGCGPSSRRTPSARCRSASTRTRWARRSQYLLGYAEAKAGRSSRTRSRPTRSWRSRTSCRALRWIVYNDPRGMRKYDDPRLLEPRAADRARPGPARPDASKQAVAAGRGEEVAMLCTTSGTTAHPKLAMLQHRPLLEHVARRICAPIRASRPTSTSRSCRCPGSSSRSTSR